MQVRDPNEAGRAVIEALRDRGFRDVTPPDHLGREASVINDPNLAAE